MPYKIKLKVIDIIILIIFDNLQRIYDYFLE